MFIGPRFPLPSRHFRLLNHILIFLRIVILRIVILRIVILRIVILIRPSLLSTRKRIAIPFSSIILFHIITNGCIHFLGTLLANGNRLDYYWQQRRTSLFNFSERFFYLLYFFVKIILFIPYVPITFTFRFLCSHYFTCALQIIKSLLKTFPVTIDRVLYNRIYLR